MSGFMRQFVAGLRAMIVFTVVLGLAYPVLVWGIAQLVAPRPANGSLVEVNGRPVASTLIGQNFSDPKWLHPRPSAAGDGYDASASSGSNLGPNSDKLTEQITTRRADIARADGVPESAVPPDAVTASSSGLDPHISPAYAAIQVNRIAAARGIPADRVRQVIAAHTHGRILGFLGEPAVNVVEVNLALEGH